ncbi:DUF637 domain-containing protein [Stutzerimonas frequens]|uniref:two-partner secretion domain-containing protein n=1 Tax=Stutzerimonas frequens TaxID=2968969 RepID=UPI00190B915C|nr:DUF637 domain-containing protein [Stutzerimonas frequens]MBK3759222.1 filamentous hemagglutinin N-terminal domain-containing protein [Stutzerimonas frequens]
MDVRSPFFQNIAAILAGVMFLNPIVSAAAELTAAAGSGVTIGQAGNGVPVVNIAAPNGNGLSHNKFKDYNVGQQGLILNNATTATQSTQLGGIILGNSKLNGKAAGMILNEVTGSNASRLQGYTEVAGKSAHVIVANPHGISCDGCGFINTPRVTLSTGTPVIENGRLDRFDVNGGQIAIEGQGLNASNVDQFDLITRSAKINAELHANKLNVIAGRNVVKADDLSVIAKTPDGSDKPLLAIDSSALGGMYAGAIRLVGTEAGVGVKLAGDMAASAGDIQIDASGRLSMGRSAAARDLQIAAQQVELNGDTYATGAARITAQDGLINRQSLATGDSAVLRAGELTNQGIVEAGVKADNSRSASADLTLAAETIRNSGTLIAGRTLAATASQTLDNQGGTLSAGTTRIDTVLLNNQQGRVLGGQQVTVDAAQLDNRDGLLQSRGNAELRGDSLDNRGGDIVALGDLTVAAGMLNNGEQGRITAQGQARLETEALNNRGGLVSGKQVSVRAADLIDNRDGGLIVSDGALDLNAGRLDSSNGGEVSARGDLTADLGSLSQAGGRMIGEAAVALQLNNGELDNRGGLIHGKGPVSLAGADTLDNRGGEVSSSSSLTVGAERLDNGQGGRLIAAQTLDAQAGQLNNQGGLVSGWQGVTVSGGSLDNSQGGTLSSRSGGVKAELSGHLDNSGEGALVSRGDQQLHAASLDNRGNGIISSEGAITAELDAALDNGSGGLISATGELELQAGTVRNVGGQLGGASDVRVRAESLDNSSGQLTATGTLDLLLGAALLNSGGRLASGRDLLLHAGDIDNRSGRITSQGLLDLFAASLTNAGGTVGAQASLAIQATGTLDNSADGLVFSQADSVTVAAGDLDNRQGALQGQANVLVKTAGAVDNRGGSILSQQGDIDVEAASLDNGNGGILNSLVGQLKLATSGLFGNVGGTTQAQTLSVQAGRLDNSQGHLSAIGGDSRITTGDLLNVGGGLYARDAVEIEAEALDNSAGKVGAQYIDFSLRGILNNTAGLVESASGLTVHSAGLTNDSGALRALGQLESTVITTSGVLDNRRGLIESASRDLNLNVGSFLNDGGTVRHVGSGIFGLASSLATAAGGTLITNGALKLDAANWTHSGVIQAKRLELNVGDFTQTASGQLLAGESLVATGGRWVNNGVIASDGDLSLNLTAGYSGGGQLTSLGGLTLNAASLDLATSGRIAGGAVTSLDIARLAINRGRVTSTGDFTLRSATLNNYGTLGGAEQVRLATNALLNDRGLIFSGGDLAVRGADLRNLRGDIYSLGDFSFAANDAGALGQSFRNISGAVESDGTMIIAARAFENARESLDIASRKLSARFIYKGCGDCGGSKESSHFDLIEIDRTEATNVSPQAQLLAGRNLTISSATFDNRYSLVATGGDLRIDTGTFNNQGAQVGDVTTIRDVHAHRVYMDRVQERREEADAFNARNWIGSSTYNPGDIEAELNSFISRHVYIISSPSSPTYSNAADYSGIIQAAGSVRVNATTELNNSVRRPGFAYVSGGNRVDTTQPGNTIATYVTLNPQLPPDLQQKQVNPLTLPGFTLPQGEHGLFRLSNQSSQDATASAAAGTASPQPPRGIQAVPSTGRAAGAHKYLIETNPALTDLRQFMSSDYLLGNLGYDTDATQKRLGDGLYEQRLIREAIVARTGQRYLAGLTSDEAMFRYLMDNAIASKDALGLSLGISLTSEQVAALTHDIVWMEEHEVMGEKVLVPVLYLAQAEGRLASTGALIQGRDVSLISGGNLNNQGTLRASQSLDVTAGNINNSGLMQANERLQLLATNSIRNTAGGIIAGRDVSAVALTGDIINERSVTTHLVTRGASYLDRQDFADSAARIEASNNVQLSAGRDLLNVGSAISAGGDASLTAGRDLVIASQQEQDTMSRRDRRSTTDIQAIAQHTSDVKISGDLTLQADRDLAVIGSKVQAGGDMALEAGENITIASAANESHFEHHRKGGGKKVDVVRDSVTQQSAELIAGGDLTAISDGDTNIVASSISAGDEAYLYAGGELNLLAAQNSEYSLYDKQSKGSFGSKETQRDEVTTVRNIGSTITTGGDLTLVSEGDQLYQKARLESGNDLTLDSGGAITFEAVKDLDQESHEKSESSLAWQSAKGKGTTDETLRQSVLIAKGETVINAVDGLKIDIKHVNQQTISQTIDAMVKADPELAWIKEAEARGDVDWQRVKEIHDSFKYESSGLGAGAQMVMAIVAAAFLGPLMGALASNVAAGTINNGGDLGKGIKFALNEDNLKSYAIAAAAAYVITPQLDQAFGVSTDNVNKITKGFDLGNLSDVIRFGAYSAAQGFANAGLETAVNGGSFSDNLEVSLIAQAGNVGMAIGFNMIGDWAYGKYPDGSPQKIMAHALFGGLVAEATGSDFRTGALAAGANEALSTTLTSLVGGDENLELMSAQIVGMLAAAAVDGDIFKGTEIAKFATAYNQQVHRQAKQRLERGLAVLHEQGKYPDLDADTVLQDLRKIADGDIKSTKELNPKVVNFLNTEFTPAGLRDQMFEPENWEVYASIAIDLAFPTPSSKAAAVRRIGEKVSKETLASLEAKYGADLLLQGGAKGTATTGGQAASTLPKNFGESVLSHNTQIGVRNSKAGTISGAHNSDAFLESVEITGAKISNKITDARFPGLVEYRYQLPRTNTKGELIGGYKPTSTKTTYDPKVLPDSKVADMSSRAAVQAEALFKTSPALREASIKVDGYYFQVTRNSKTGEITNSFITMPPRTN